MVELDKVKEIKEVNNYADVNHWLQQGWKLITFKVEKQNCYNMQPDGKYIFFDKMYKLYILGRVK